MNETGEQPDPRLPVRASDPSADRLGPARRSRPPAPGSRVAPAPPQFTPGFLWWVFTRSWRVVVPVGLLLASIAAAVLLWTYVPQYTATALIRIEDSQQYIAFRNAAGGGGTSSFIRTQVQIMRSPVVLREVLADKRVGSATHLRDKSDRIQAIQSALQIKQVGGSELFEVAYAAPSPQEASDVVSAVITEYFDRQSDEAYKRRQRVIELLEKERVRRQVEVERLQRNVIELSKEVTGRDPFRGNVLTDVDRAISPVASLHQQLTDLEVQIEILEAEVQSIEESGASAVDYADRTGMITLQVETNPDVRRRKQEIADMRAEMRSIEALARGNRYQTNRRYRSLEQLVQRREQELGEYKQLVRQQALAARRSAQGRGGKTLAEAKREQIASLRLREQTLRKRFEEELADVQESGGKATELQFAKADLAREEKVFEMIAARKLALQTESEAPARVYLVDPATTSNVADQSAPWKKLIVACAMAMAVPFGLALMREATLRRVTDAEQLYGDTHMRVLGEIVSFPARRVAANPRQLPKRLRKDMYAFAESIDSLRMSLMFIAPSQAKRVIALTSASAQEGKTSVSVALAMSFANATKEDTLVIDGDMRDSDVMNLLDLRDGDGLCEVLDGQRRLEDVVIPAPGVNNLYVIRAGACKGAPHHLAQPHRIRELIDSLRERFSTIIIDTPPVLGASEAISFCRAADATAMCARRGVSRMRQVRLATEKLETAGVEIAGTVLSEVPTSGHAYAYAYGYGYRDDAMSPTPLVDS